MIITGILNSSDSFYAFLFGEDKLVSIIETPVPVTRYALQKTIVGERLWLAVALFAKGKFLEDISLVSYDYFEGENVIFKASFVPLEMSGKGDFLKDVKLRIASLNKIST